MGSKRVVGLSDGILVGGPRSNRVRNGVLRRRFRSVERHYYDVGVEMVCRVTVKCVSQGSFRCSKASEKQPRETSRSEEEGLKCGAGQLDYHDNAVMRDRKMGVE